LVPLLRRVALLLRLVWVVIQLQGRLLVLLLLLLMLLLLLLGRVVLLPLRRVALLSRLVWVVNQLVLRVAVLWLVLVLVVYVLIVVTVASQLRLLGHLVSHGLYKHALHIHRLSPQSIHMPLCCFFTSSPCIRSFLLNLQHTLL
jgi:hypothetical protein